MGQSSRQRKCQHLKIRSSDAEDGGCQFSHDEPDDERQRRQQRQRQRRRQRERRGEKLDSSRSHWPAAQPESNEWPVALSQPCLLMGAAANPKCSGLKALPKFKVLPAQRRGDESPRRGESAAPNITVDKLQICEGDSCGGGSETKIRGCGSRKGQARKRANRLGGGMGEASSTQPALRRSAWSPKELAGQTTTTLTPSIPSSMRETRIVAKFQGEGLGDGAPRTRRCHQRHCLLRFRHTPNIVGYIRDHTCAPRCALHYVSVWLLSNTTTARQSSTYY